MRVGSVIYSDGLKAYRSNLSQMGFSHAYISHGDGFFVKGEVSTNSVDGAWGRFKNTLRGKNSVYGPRLPLHLAEFMWRHNLRVTSPLSSVFDAIVDVLASFSSTDDKEDIADLMAELSL